MQTTTHYWTNRMRPTQFGRAVFLSSTSIAVFSFLAAPAVADDAATVLNTITVSGDATNDPARTTVVHSADSTTKTDTSIQKSSEAISVVTEKEIEKRNAQTIQQVIDYTAGVTTDEFGSDDRYDYFRIRGFDETALGTYRDGLPARIPAWFTASRLEPYGLQEVQVLKGSTSSLFGLNGPGGLINAITKRPTLEPLHEIYTTVGTDQHLETGFDLSGPIDKEGVWSLSYDFPWLLCDKGAAARHPKYAGKRRGTDREWVGRSGPRGSVIAPVFSHDLNG